jgi:hypothetical protein
MNFHPAQRAQDHLAWDHPNKRGTLLVNPEFAQVGFSPRLCLAAPAKRLNAVRWLQKERPVFR